MAYRYLLRVNLFAIPSTESPMACADLTCWKHTVSFNFHLHHLYFNPCRSAIGLNGCLRGQLLLTTRKRQETTIIHEDRAISIFACPSMCMCVFSNILSILNQLFLHRKCGKGWGREESHVLNRIETKII